ncbi:MAG: EcoAI/FtnUII family type I restriction enzme subunit R [Cyanophyceae cyanobacterium]
MAKLFFTTKEAAEIVGCTARQVQHWRNKKLVVPTVDTTGTGHSVYYSRENLTDLAIVHFILERGYNFQVAETALEQLREIDSRYNSPQAKGHYLLKWDPTLEKLTLVEYDTEQVERELVAGQLSVTSLGLDPLNQRIEWGIRRTQSGNQRVREGVFHYLATMNEADTCREYVFPRLQEAGWATPPYSITEQRPFTDGRILPTGNKVRRGKLKRADYLLRYQRDFLLAVVEAKANYKSPLDGLQQAKSYAEILGLKFAYATNGTGIVEFDFTTGLESTLTSFPPPETLWARYCRSEGLSAEQVTKLLTPYNLQSGKPPRYYQEIAINRTVEALIKGEKRLLLTMATGTGKTTTAFQICWKLWSSLWNLEGGPRHPKILYLADRNVLVDDPMNRDFAPFGDAVYKVQGEVVLSRDIYFAIYQAIAQDERRPGLYREFPSDFFDLIIVDECHRGSARADSSWREILAYFEPAAQLGLTATPLRDESRDTYSYFGNPLYTYSLKQGIEDGFLAPYRVYRVVTSADAVGWQPSPGELDRFGREIPEGLYGTKDFEKVIALRSRTEAIAKHLTEFLKKTDRFAKTIVFCVDQEHAHEMRGVLNNLNADLVQQYPNYVCRVTSDEANIGRGHLDMFKDVDQVAPVILTTSQLLTTGVDAPTTKNIVIARVVGSISEFKQIIGRGTRVREEYGKLFFSILDYTGSATLHFADPEFDGDPALIDESAIDDEGNVTEETVVQPEPEPEEGSQEIPNRSGIMPSPEVTEPRKYYVDNVQVQVVHELVMEMDADGNQLRCVEYADYTGEQLRKIYPNSEALRASWQDGDQRELVLAQLEERGINVAALAATLDQQEADPFDLLCHLAFNAPLLTRRERAERLRRNLPDLFEQYGVEARAILDDLLEKYADYGLTQLKVPDVLRIPPISNRGNIAEIIRIFNGAEQLKAAVEQLQSNLYAA